MGILITAICGVVFCSREYIYRTVDVVKESASNPMRAVANYWFWYDNLKEPYRFFVAMTMISPLMFSPYLIIITGLFVLSREVINRGQ